MQRFGAAAAVALVGAVRSSLGPTRGLIGLASV